MPEQESAPVTTQAPAAPANPTPPAPTGEKAAEAAPPPGNAPEKKAEEKPATKAEEKPAEKTAERVVPEKYELKAPDGTLLKQAEIDKITEFAKEQKLTNEEAQKILEERSTLKSGYQQELREDFNRQREQWKSDFLKDPEFGGEKAKESAELAKRFVDRFADADLKKAFDEFGFGDHPGLIRFFARAGRAMAEDKHVSGGQPAAPDRVEAKSVLYPNLK